MLEKWRKDQTTYNINFFNYYHSIVSFYRNGQTVDYNGTRVIMET